MDTNINQKELVGLTPDIKDNGNAIGFLGKINNKFKSSEKNQELIMTGIKEANENRKEDNSVKQSKYSVIAFILFIASFPIVQITSVSPLLSLVADTLIVYFLYKYSILGRAVDKETGASTVLASIGAGYVLFIFIAIIAMIIALPILLSQK